MPPWLLIGAALLPAIGQIISGLFRPRQRPPQQPQPQPRVIPLPQRPITEEDIKQTLFLTRGLFERMRQTGTQGHAQDITKGLLREAQKLAEESAAIRGQSGGLGTRAIAESIWPHVPSFVQVQQGVETQALQNVLNELMTMAGLGGRVGGVFTPQMLQFMGGLAATEAGLTGMYNPPFHYGLYSPVDYARYTQGQQMWQNIQNILQWLMLFLPVFGRK